MKLKIIIPYLIYLFINSLFVVKYTSRQTQFNEYMLTISYSIIIVLIIYLYNKVNLKHYYRFLYFFVIITFFVFTIYLNISIDGNTLNVDRWSAMEVGIRALLNGQYPYSAIDHLGGRTSNLPTLIFLGIPFYLLGNIGFLQSFSFILFSYIVFIAFNNYKDRLFCLLLLILSPSYLWEIYVKSDLMSNFIIILMLMVIVQIKISKKERINPLILSFVSTAAILTRLTAIIPITLLLFKKFYNYSLKEKTLFIIVSLITITLFGYICLNKVSDFNHFKQHNPFELQNRQLPFFISFITILIPLIYSFQISNLKLLIKSSVFFLLLPILLAMLINISNNGIYTSIFNSSFDISYLNIVMPFLLILLTYDYKILLPTMHKNNVKLAT